MRGALACPRCGGKVQPPGLWSSFWTCQLHGAVEPLQPIGQPGPDLVHAVAKQARVPVWLPWPLPSGYVVTGVARAGDERSGARAIALACTGPAPIRSGAGELVLVAEEPGVGLGAHLAGLPGPDPGDNLDQRQAPQAKIIAGGHPTSLWLVSGSPADRAVYVGEALGQWLWTVLWPADAGYLLSEDLSLVDLRDAGHELDLPFGALSPRLRA